MLLTISDKTAVTKNKELLESWSRGTNSRLPFRDNIAKTEVFGKFLNTLRRNDFNMQRNDL